MWIKIKSCDDAVSCFPPIKLGLVKHRFGNIDQPQFLCHFQTKIKAVVGVKVGFFFKWRSKINYSTSERWFFLLYFPSTSHFERRRDAYSHQKSSTSLEAVAAATAATTAL